MPEYIQGVELTQDGMRAIFARMGYPGITSGCIYNGAPTINKEELNKQGFMPVLTGVSPTQESGHWIMLIKGKEDNQYYLFDPLGEASGKNYQSILARQLPHGATLSVIPNNAGLNMGLCGYWVASAGLRARAALTGDHPSFLANLGQTITQEMRDELNGDGYTQITGWLRAVAHEFPAGDAQPDATALRRATEKDLRIESPQAFTGKGTAPKEIATKPTALQETTLPIWNGFSLYTDETVRQAVQYAYDNYLGKKYTGTVEARPLYLGKDGDDKDPKTVFRPIHGLGHTLRTMAYAETIVEEARKAKLRGEPLGKFKDGRTIADVTPDELKKIMLSQAFFVTGRDDEESTANYAKYHEQSKDAFLKYVEDNKSTLIPHVFKDENDVNFYAKVIEDKNHKWENSPAHVLINQGHMVDLVRVKQPAESYLESYFKSLQPWIGIKAAEAVFAKQRQFFHATFETVTAFDSENAEPHLIMRTNEFRYVIGENAKPIREEPKEGETTGELKFFPPSYKLQGKEKFEFGIAGLGCYVIGEDGNPIRNPPKKGGTQGSLAFFPTSYKLQDNERYMSVSEYLKLDEVQRRFPGSGKKLQRGLADKYKTDQEYLRHHVYSDGRVKCENDVNFCLGQLQTANYQAKISPLKGVVQSSEKGTRREANGDEVAAARIIRQILAAPNSIHEDHVLLNGQKLEEQFFRGLLAKCDMAIVGVLLNDMDIRNIDGLMQHEKDTIFHEPGEEPVAREPIGKKWAETYRTDPQNKRGTEEHSIKMALIHLMQDGSWYYRRLNAVAQGRDTGSSFKEVLISTLMIPLTNKALADIQQPEYGRKPHPPQVHKGLMSLPPALTQKLLNQSEAIIANTTMGLFSDPTAQIYQKMKINHLTNILAKTCSSTSASVDSATFFTNGADNENNIRLDLEDPNGLLDAKRVGRHGPGTENEYSVYVPDDVCLIPLEVNKGNPHVIRLIAIKSPDFLPRHESGFAVEPFIKMQNGKMTETINAAQSEVHENLDKKLRALRIEMVRQSHLPIREGFLERMLHYFSGKDNQKISLDRKNFFNEKVIPVLQECHIALRLNNMDMMQRALAKFPSDQEWSGFKSQAAISAKAQMDAIGLLSQKKISFQNELFPSLTQCQNALEKQNVADALQALESIPSDENLRNMSSISSSLKEQIQRTKQELTENLVSLQRAVITPVITNPEQVKARYETLITSITQRVADLDTAKLPDVTHIKKAITQFNNLQEELKLLRNEKARIHTGSEKIDFADIEKLEEQLHAFHTKLYDAYVLEATKEIALLEKEKPKNLSDVKKMISSFNDRLAEVEQLRQEKERKHGVSKDALDLSDINKLKGQLQTINHFLVKAVINSMRTSLNQMEVKTFHKQEKEAQQNFLQLDKLAKTLENSATTQKQQAEIQQLKQFFVEKQTAYPAMAQLQFKSEALIIQLRELCEAHQNNLANDRQIKTEEITKNRWTIFQGVTDWMHLTTDERITITNKGKALNEFKEALNNDKYDIKQLINSLAQKSPAELENAIGISEESAEKLHKLFNLLDRGTTFMAKIEERSKLIDEILVEIDKKSQPELIIDEEQQTLKLV